MNVSWLASFSASCMYTAHALIEQRQLNDQNLTQAMQESIDLFIAEITSQGWPQTVLLQNLDALSCTIESNLELAQTALIKTLGRDRIDGHVQPLTRCITAIENAYRKALPNVLDDLQLRIGPLQLLWEACGPGMLKMIGQLTDENLLTEEAKVVLVHPISGGGGTAHLKFNCVSMQAVLTNTHETLPEVLRLNWLLSQLNLDLPMYSENIPLTTRENVAALSMIPVVLTAADHIDFLKYDEANIGLAIQAWHLPVSDGDKTAAILKQWWETYQAKRPHWAVALGGLQQMLFGKSN